MTFSPSQRPLVIWRLTDGKPGHEKQTLGLAHALSRLAPCQIHELAIHSRWQGLGNWILKRFPYGQNTPKPDFILAAGHTTHFHLLAAHRAYGGKTVVLMKPSLPLSWFDYCLIPEHDNPPPAPNVISTRGALTNVIPSALHDANKGLILIGGPSAHFHWDSKKIAVQVETLVREEIEIHWTLTTSRRTPDDFLQMLQSDQINVMPRNQTPPGWVENQLEYAGQTWVTPDSASMLYEALTSGCKVGIFALDPVMGSRVANGINARIAESTVATIGDIMKLDIHNTTSVTFNEAERCAKLILASEAQ